MLVGREAERERLRWLLEAARAGGGSALVLRGEPGIGKTALLEDLRAAAGGFLVLEARGVESESRLAFAGLADLVRPILDRLDRVPAAQQVALRAALALGPPAVPDRFAAYAATLSLLGAVASEGPVLAVVDDAHWLDPPSQEALLFCARRIEDEPVAMVAASRERPPERLEVSGVDELEVGGLGDRDARSLLGEVAGGPLAPAVADELLALAHGNPLALLELPRTLGPDERAGRAALPRTMRAGDALVRAYRTRIEAAGDGARRAALLAAVSEDGALRPLTVALAACGADAAELEAAEAAGLVVLGAESARVSHPLLRSVILQMATPHDRRDAHRALAEALGPEQVEQRAGHLAEAAIAPDEEAASALDQAAAVAAGKTGYAVAASTLERAAAIGAEQAAAARLLGAAEMAMAAGQLERSESLLKGIAVHHGPARAAAAHLRGLLLMHRGDVEAAAHDLVRDGERVAAEDPVRAAMMIADAVVARTLSGWCREALRIAERAYALAGAGEAVPPNVLGYLGIATTLRGGARRAWEFADMLDEANATVDPMSVEGQMLALSQVWRIWIGDFEREIVRLDALIERARAAGAAGFLGYPLAWGCELDFRLGRWQRARAEGEEAVALFTETGQDLLLSFALSSLATVEAGLGLSMTARARAEAARARGRAAGMGSAKLYSAAVIALVAMGDGDPQEARGALEPLLGELADFGLAEPGTVLWQPELIEAYARLGMSAEARRELAVLAEQAHGTGGTWARAVTCRCRGLIDDDIDRHFGEALALHALTPMPFERARTELAYGSRLRRAGCRTDAREQLGRALATFEELGAEPWARQAREEIAASGARLRPRRATRPGEELSPREHQVALAVASGLTNRQAAARLFLSEKTIERHLGSVYRTLGLRSRTELAARMAREEAGAGAGGPRASAG